MRDLSLKLIYVLAGVLGLLLLGTLIGYVYWGVPMIA